MPQDENQASTSSLSLSVAWSSVEPTVTTYGSMPGEVTVPLFGPLLPAAATTTMPRRQAISAAAASGSNLYDSSGGNARDLGCSEFAPGYAYDETDVRLLEGTANLIALALFGVANSQARQSDADAILARMDDALLVLDSEARVVRLNHAALGLLGARQGGVSLGQRIDRSQDANQWPLGRRE